MNAMRNTLTALMILTSLPTLAQDQLRVEFGGWGKHLPQFEEEITNNTFNIFAVEYKGVAAGRFSNSYDRETWFVAKTWRGDIVGDLSWTASLGVNKGYRECFGDNGGSGRICPHGYVGLDYEVGRAYISVKTQVAVTLFSLGFKLF